MSARPVWVVRAGKHGEDEEAALELGMALVRFREFEDLRKFDSADQLTDRFLEHQPKAPRKRAENYARQLWALKTRIQVGDIVVLPLKIRRGQIAVGVVTGGYQYAQVGGETRHTLKVNWTHPDLPRSTFRQDLLYSFGAFLTVFRVRRNDAENRIAAVRAGQPDPGYAGEETDPDEVSEDTATAVAEPDLEQAAADQIVDHIRAAFPGHDMQRLVAAVLVADGFQTTVPPKGPDGGVDVLAGRGPLGLDAPHLCVQVKATEGAADVKVLRELNGTMQAYSADQGLLVSWSGFTQAAVREARQQRFRIRLWDQVDLVKAVLRTYDRLDPEMQAELPLKQVWMLVQDEAGEGE